ncbi:MAG TPA: BamA/TamA family outer membrane protein [Gemmatimonadaceae bacterium]
MVIISAVFFATAMAQGDSASARDSMPRSRTTALPIVSYSDVTGLQFGGTVVRGFRVGRDTGTHPSFASAYLAGTARGHAKGYLQLDRWSADNAMRSRVRVEHISYPLPFYGVGRDTPDEVEEWYSSGVTTVHVFVDQLTARSVFLHGGLRYTRSRLRDGEPGGMLDQEIVPGAAGSDVVALSAGLIIDSRDDIGAPRGGVFARIVPSASTRRLGSDMAFRRLTIDARRYNALGGHTIATQVQYDGLDGTAPFDLMPMIGADTAMRGYARGRFRDQHAFTAQAEFRSAPWRRLGAVVFAGAGTVAPAASKLVTGAWFPSYGAGVRYLVSPRYRTMLRADLALGRGTFGLHVGVGEAF